MMYLGCFESFYIIIICSGEEIDKFYSLDHCRRVHWLAGQHYYGINNRQGMIADIIVGIVGAFVGGYFLSPLFNIATINESNYSIPSLLVSLGGAIILLAISKLFRNIGGFLLIILIALVIYIYVNCWSMDSTSAFCAAVRSVPFMQ